MIAFGTPRDFIYQPSPPRGGPFVFLTEEFGHLSEAFVTIKVDSSLHPFKICVGNSPFSDGDGHRSSVKHNEIDDASKKWGEVKKLYQWSWLKNWVDCGPALLHAQLSNMG